jgi:hypothetical protein
MLRAAQSGDTLIIGDLEGNVYLHDKGYLEFTGGLGAALDWDAGISPDDKYTIKRILWEDPWNYEEISFSGKAVFKKHATPARSDNPDYVTFSAGVGTGVAVGINWTVDRHGNWYFGWDLGVGAGLFPVSVTAGRIEPKVIDTPIDEEYTKEFLEGFDPSLTVGYWGLNFSHKAVAGEHDFIIPRLSLTLGNTSHRGTVPVQWE